MDPRSQPGMTRRENMPSYKVHLIGGAATYGLLALTMPLLFTSHLQPYHQAMLLGLTLTGSIFPDIDITSRIQIMFFRLMFVVLPLLLFLKYFLTFMYVGAACIGLILIKHRTLTHRTWFLFALSLICATTVSIKHPALTEFAFIAGLYFFIGAVSHLVLDYGIKQYFKR